VIAFAGVDCRTINESRRTPRGPEIAFQRLLRAARGADRLDDRFSYRRTVASDVAIAASAILSAAVRAPTTGSGIDDPSAAARAR
jgi:hypothetical protein